MDKTRRLELIQRSLGIRHKLKVHDSMKAPDTHEDLAIMMMTRWELEDELRAIEEILAGHRENNVSLKRKAILNEDASLPPEEREKRAEKRLQEKAAKSKKARG